MWESLPAVVFGANILCFLSLKDIVRLDSAILSWRGREQFLQSLPYRPALILNSISDSILKWFMIRQFRLKSPTISFQQAISLRSELVEDICLCIEGEIPAEVNDLEIRDKVTRIKVMYCNTISDWLDRLKFYNQVKRISFDKLSCQNFIAEWVRGSVELMGDIVAIYAYTGVTDDPLNFSIFLEYISGIKVEFQKIFMDDMHAIAATALLLSS